MRMTVVGPKDDEKRIPMSFPWLQSRVASLQFRYVGSCREEIAC